MHDTEQQQLQLFDIDKFCMDHGIGEYRDYYAEVSERDLEKNAESVLGDGDCSAVAIDRRLSWLGWKRYGVILEHFAPRSKTSCPDKIRMNKRTYLITWRSECEPSIDNYLGSMARSPFVCTYWVDGLERQPYFVLRRHNVERWQVEIMLDRFPAKKMGRSEDMIISVLVSSSNEHHRPYGVLFWDTIVSQIDDHMKTCEWKEYWKLDIPGPPASSVTKTWCVGQQLYPTAASCYSWICLKPLLLVS